jgi:tetratricopeptide (TPR) repeat protein
MTRNTMQRSAPREKSGWPRLALVTLALVLGLEGPLVQPGLAQSSPQVREGYALLERGWVNDAIAAFQAALRGQPDSPEARLGLALAYQRAGRDADAWTAYQAVLAVSPDQPQALAAVGELGGYRPEWQPQGIAALTRLLAQNPNQVEARRQRALLYGYQGRFSEALADYGPLLQDNPDSATLLGAAQVHGFSGDFATALALFNRYRQTATLPTEALAIYALARQETGDPAGAIAVLEPVLPPSDRRDDLALGLRTGLANAYDASGQTSRALELLAPLEGYPEARLPLARAYSAIGRRQQDPSLFGQATELYRQALGATSAPSYGLRVEVADVLSEWPDTEALAQEMFAALVAENPGVVSLQVRERLLAYRLGQVTAAQVSQQLLPLVDPLPSAAPEQRAIATALVQLDQPHPALLPVYKAIAAEVDAPLLTYRIAQIHLQTQDLAAAQAALLAYQAQQPGDWGTELLLADLERQLGDLDASAQRYERVVVGQPSPTLTADALRGLTFVRTLQGQPEAALPLYQQAMAADPDSPTYGLGYALLAYRTGQLAKAEAAATLNQWLLTQSLDAPPPELVELVGALPPDPSRAGLYTTLLTRYPDDIWLRWRTIQLLAQANPTQAQVELEDLIAAHSDDPTVYFFQGELAQQQGNLPLAATAYQQVLAQQPQNLGALSALAGVRFQQGDLAAARTLYGQVLALDPDQHPARRAIAELNIADDHKLLGLDQLRQLAVEGNTSGQGRIQDVEFDLLRRRGFQPPWERY